MNKMPVLFIGHGSPMNAIEENEFTETWIALSKELPKPKAILSISAHWYTEGTRICNSLYPTQIYDMYGFPRELYELKYPVKGSPEFAHNTKELLSEEVRIDNSWGIDHGTWSVLCRMYPEAELPVYQLSINRNADAAAHYRMGQELSTLRDQGVLILGSGNVVHNLSRINWEQEGGYSWAEEFDAYIKNAVLEHQYDQAVRYRNAGMAAEYAFPTPEHYYPLLYVLGAVEERDKVRIYNDSRILGSLSMTSYLFG